MEYFLSLLMLCTAMQYASTERFFVITKSDDPCPGKFTGEPCLTITQFVSGSYTRFLSNPNLVSSIILDLQPGEHQITNSYDLLVQRMESFVLRATSRATLNCRNSYFNISNVQYVQLSGMQFVNCNKNIVIKSANQLIVDNCEFTHGEGLWIADTMKGVIIGASFNESTQSIYVQQTSVTISQCKFTNDCVGVFGENSFVTITQSIFKNNTANCALESNKLMHTGGAIHLQYSAVWREGLERGSNIIRDKALTIINSTFEGNSAQDKGGVIYVSGVNIKINGSTFVNNKARFQGGAVYIASTRSSTEGTSVIHNCRFISNHASIGGGAVYAPASVQINECTFIGNTARLRGGGAIYTGGHNSNIDVTRSIFRNNSAAYCGVFDVDELHHNVKLLSSTFSQNTATGESDIRDILKFSGIKSNIGGVICVRNASVSILGSNFTQNVAAGYGGVMYVDDSSITIEKSIFDGNGAGYDGGVTYTEQHRVQLMIRLSSFFNNQARAGDGGVMYVGRSHSQVNINESRFGFNSAAERGGVIVIYGGMLEMNNVDFYNNTAKVGGGIGIACNSETIVPDKVVTSTDPEVSFCSLYDEQIRQYDDQTGAPPVKSPQFEVTTASSSSSPSIAITSVQETFDESTDTFTSAITAATTANHGITSSSSPSVYFELNGNVFLNNSAVSLQDVGEGENALICITDNQDCCGTPPDRQGEFYYPSGDQVPIRSHGDEFYRQRGDEKIYLNRRKETTSPTGTFSCVIPNATGRLLTIYIDLLQ